MNRVVRALAQDVNYEQLVGPKDLITYFADSPLAKAVAEGAFGPDLAGRGLNYEQVKRAVRQPWGIMPRFLDEQVNGSVSWCSVAVGCRRWSTAARRSSLRHCSPRWW